MNTQNRNPVSNTTNTTARGVITAFTAISVVTILACGPNQASDVGDSFGGTGGTAETGSPEPEVWAEVVCTMRDGGDVWYGRPVGSVDSWVELISETKIADKFTLDFWLEVDSWLLGDCAAGLTPAGFFPEYKCLVPIDGTAETTMCLSGGDGWFTLVDHSCRALGGTGPAWPGGACMADGTAPGSSPWDAIGCDVNGLCWGTAGETVAEVIPSCVIESLVPCGTAGDGDGDPAGCLPGALDCECMPDGACGLGLDCRGGICEVCPAGELGCWCHQDETCDPGLACNSLFVCE